MKRKFQTDQEYDSEDFRFQDSLSKNVFMNYLQKKEEEFPECVKEIKRILKKMEGEEKHG